MPIKPRNPNNIRSVELGASHEDHTHVEADVTDLDHYTDTDFDTQLATKDTDDLTEGVTNLYLTAERVEDFVGAMLAGNTETLITVTYDDTDGTIDFVVENDLSLYDNSVSQFITDITGSPLSELSDVTITSIASGEILKWNGTGWVNQTLAEAGIAAATHTHTESDITDLDHPHELADMSDVGVTTATNRNVLVANGVSWESRALVEADISDLDHYTDTDANAAIDVRVNKAFVDALNVDADTLDGEDATAFADAVHTHTEAEITDLDHDDTDAIHDNVAGEIALLTEKVTPVDADLILIEDSEASNAKKKVQLSNLPGGGGGASAMDDLTDADTSTDAPQEGDLLTWDGTNWVPYHSVGYDLHSDVQDFMRGYRAAMGDPYYYGRIYEDFGSGEPTVFGSATDGGLGAGAVEARAGGAFANIPLGIMETRAASASNGAKAYISTPQRSINLASMGSAEILIRAFVQLSTLSDESDGFWTEFGLMDVETEDVSTASEFIGFYGDDRDSGQWIARNETGSSVTTTLTGVTMATGSTYLLEILHSATETKFYINGTLEATHTTNLSTTDCLFHAGISKTAGENTRQVWWDFCEIIYKKR